MTLSLIFVGEAEDDSWGLSLLVGTSWQPWDINNNAFSQELYDCDFPVLLDNSGCKAKYTKIHDSAGRN